MTTGFHYSIKDEEKEFFKSSTGIGDDEELKKHICKVQAEAYSIFPYTCIRVFYFLNFQLFHYPAYKQVLKLGQERPGAIYLEIGCALGTDIRKLITDGYPRENVIASDIYDALQNYARELSFGLDIFDSSVFDPKPTTLKTDSSLPPLQSLTSLTPLHSRVSVIHISSVFHLFPPEKQQRLAHILANMLSPSPGSIILGTQSATDSGIHKLGMLLDIPGPTPLQLG